jgi:CRP/FNR family cyclic AMP-dependent transcriptional regulator
MDPVRRSSTQKGQGRRQWPPGSLLGSVSDHARDELLELGTAVQYPDAGRTLIREGERSRFVVILLDGAVKATGTTPEGRTALLAIRVGGDLVGEFAAIDDSPRSATVTTCGAVVARFVKHGEFLDCLRGSSEIAFAVNRAVVGKLRLASARRVDFSGCDVPTRVARVLYQVAVSYGDRDGNRSVIRWLTQPELASLADAAEPTVHKSLRQLRAAGMVLTQYRSVTVLDLAGLKAIAYP